MSSRHAPSREKAQIANSIKAIFQKYDADGNGIICRSEMRDVLTNLGIRQQYMNPLMNAIDVNGDGLIDYKEFVEWILHEGDGADEIRDRMRSTKREQQEVLPEDEYLAQMRMAQSSRGFAGASDPRQTFQSATMAAGSMKRSFQKFDADGNGTIDRSEMRDVLTNLGISQKLMNPLMDAIDVNRDGKIDYNEFCDWVAYEGDDAEEIRDRMRTGTRGGSEQRATVSRERREVKSTKPRIPGTKFDDSQFHERGERIQYVEIEDPHRRRGERVEYVEYEPTAGTIPGTKFQNPHRRQGERVEYIEYEPEESLGATFQGPIPGAKFQNPRRQDPRMQTTYQADFRGTR